MFFLRSNVAVAAFLIYILFYTLFCNGNEKCRSNPEAKLSPEEQLELFDSRYLTDLNAVFGGLRFSGTPLARSFTRKMAQYRAERSKLARAASITNENAVERLLYLQQFIIDFADDPDSRNNTEFEEGLKKYGRPDAASTIGLKPECLEPYPNAKDCTTK